MNCIYLYNILNTIYYWLCWIVWIVLYRQLYTSQKCSLAYLCIWALIEKMITSYWAGTALASGLTALQFYFYTLFCPFGSLLSANANGVCLFYKYIYRPTICWSAIITVSHVIKTYTSWNLDIVFLEWIPRMWVLYNFSERR